MRHHSKGRPWLTLSLILILSGTSALFGEEMGPTDRSTRFLAAQQAYDAGDHAGAIQRYEGLITEGVSNPEVHYNLGNAYFKAGNMPEAVIHYRRAWYADPRDPEIEANLAFALNRVGAVPPPHTIISRCFQILPITGWRSALFLSYILLMAGLIVAVLVRSHRRLLLRLCLLPTLALSFSCGGWYYGQLFTTHPEWVVVEPGATALFGPIEGSTAHYTAPQGALVRQAGENSKGWVEITYDGKKGWLPARYIKRVYP